MCAVATIRDVDEETDWGEPCMVDHRVIKVEYVPSRDCGRRNNQGTELMGKACFFFSHQ